LSFRNYLKTVLHHETGAIIKEAPVRIALLSPSPYQIAIASLGFHFVYGKANDNHSVSCERFCSMVFSKNNEITELRSIESRRMLKDFPLIMIHISYELEIRPLIEMLLRSGINPLAGERKRGPVLICGGPLTSGNVLPLIPFMDAVAMGDADETISRLLEIISCESLSGRTDKFSLIEKISGIRGMFVPEIHGDEIPKPVCASDKYLPVMSRIVTPVSHFRNMFLIEVSRGCPYSCTFCMMNKKNVLPRFADPEKILSSIPSYAKRVGLVGTSVMSHPCIKKIVRNLVDRDIEIGLSSMRADLLDQEFVSLLKRGGYRTLTISCDGMSRRLRKRIKKGINENHMISAAEYARKENFRRMKIYAMTGLPEEQEKDIGEFSEMCRKISMIIPLSITVSPFVPKKNTELAHAEFEDEELLKSRMRSLKKKLAGKAVLSFSPVKSAFEEYLLASGDQEQGLRILQDCKKLM
jgi:radical SAM superfamily enzyme YgiQ (UPF0313 family)